MLRRISDLGDHRLDLDNLTTFVLYPTKQSSNNQHVQICPFPGVKCRQPVLAYETLNGVTLHRQLSFYLQTKRLTRSIVKPNIVLAIPSPASLTANDPGPKSKSLSLNSFYCGCDLDLKEDVVPNAAACTIMVMATRQARLS